MPDRLTLIALKGIPLVKPGDELIQLVANAITESGEQLMNGDIQTNGNQIIYKPPGMLSEEEQAEQAQENFWERVEEKFGKYFGYEARCEKKSVCRP